ncbi:MAG: zinc-ribbon domain-containing protein [Candidatus Krumholzibacteria bacterium]|nr:zinc-ribbon domain-containing protein [Candidatus Krumholzibacteria bacterium]
MIVTCDGCQTKYKLGDEKVPTAGFRVRCPKCRFVWRLTPPPVAIDPGIEITTNGFATGAPLAETPSGGWSASEQNRAAAVMAELEPAAMDAEVEISGNEAAAATAQTAAEQTVEETPEMKKKRERSKRLARVFVSDIVVYNQEKRDRGLADGDLITVLGPEIKKAWEAYKAKIGSEVTESSEYFRTALNDILADGQQVF